jgi:hypothetical protein
MQKRHFVTADIGIEQRFVVGNSSVFKQYDFENGGTLEVFILHVRF